MELLYVASMYSLTVVINQMQTQIFWLIQASSGIRTKGIASSAVLYQLMMKYLRYGFLMEPVSQISRSQFTIWFLRHTSNYIFPIIQQNSVLQYILYIRGNLNLYFALKKSIVSTSRFDQIKSIKVNVFRKASALLKRFFYIS